MTTKLKLSNIPDDKPVKLSIELPAEVHRDLVAYAEVMSRDSRGTSPEPARLIVPMVQRFMATDRAFARLRKSNRTPPQS
ncbi:MAG: hypothetical protein CMJ42_17100 [Phyllobacteriaceae bacterium]|nr:hypothetical protein [Phyllobacteriaceae bacterium]MBA92321.1 hypothetical protein [Phyllobacteriaceae bacterium]